jgi:hypothetical protein
VVFEFGESRIVVQKQQSLLTGLQSWVDRVGKNTTLLTRESDISVRKYLFLLGYAYIGNADIIRQRTYIHVWKSFFAAQQMVGSQRVQHQQRRPRERGKSFRPIGGTTGWPVPQNKNGGTWPPSAD